MQYQATKRRNGGSIGKQRRRAWNYGLQAGLAGAYSLYGGYKTASQARTIAKGAVNYFSTNKPRSSTKKKGMYKVQHRSKPVLTSKVLECMSGIGERIYRQRNPQRTLASANQKGYSGGTVSDTTKVETALSALKYYDPSTPAVLLTADGNAGSYSKKFYFKSAVMRLVIRNNYKSDVVVNAYICIPKQDTSIGPSAAFTNGLADVGNPSANSVMVYPTDSPQFNYLWKIAKHKKVRLKAGREINMSHNLGSFCYDPSIVDNHSLTYQKKYKACALFIQVEGTLGHDTVNDEQSQLQAGIDYYWDIIYKILYDSGVDIKDIVVTNNMNTITNAPVQSNVTAPTNYNYSVS